MKKKILLTVLLGFAMLILFPAICKATNDTVLLNVSVTENYNDAKEVVNLVNKERKAAGSKELKIDKDLMDAAMLRAGELSLYFSHTRPNGKSFFSVETKAFGENIAVGQTSPSFVMSTWMNSSGHKANILDSSYTTIGVGAVRYGGVYYWVQLFGCGANDSTNYNNKGSKSVTRKVETLTSNIDIRYNAPTSFEKKLYPNGYETRFVLVNGGWPMVCVAIDPSQFTFTSSNEQININKNGVITAKRAGTTTITATLKEEKSVKVSTDIAVIEYLNNLKIENVNDVIYTGKNICPDVIIKDGNYRLIKDKDYKLSYSNNKNSGMATIKITGIGGYSGEVIKNFKIVPPKVTDISLVSTSSNSISVKWKKIDGVTGYKIYLYNYDKNEYQYYGKSSTNQVTVKGLNPNTKYKIKVKAYKEINGTQCSGARSDMYKTITSPDVVTNIKTKWTANNMAKISWDKVKGTTQYKVFLYNYNTKSYEYYGKTSDTSIKIKNLKPNTKYKVKIRAYRTYDGIQHLGDKSDAYSIKTTK